MTKRNIVKIDEEKCNGCGLCVNSCAEGAIEIVDGKARLISEFYCDGLGACLGSCPQDAISVEEREADPFDEAMVEEHLKKTNKEPLPTNVPCQCPGTMMKQMKRESTCTGDTQELPSELSNWPIQLKLVSPMAPYFQGADIVLAADCVAFAYANFHNKFMKEKPVIIGCPKLDDGQFYVEKLTDIIKHNGLKSITVVHMEVPCCTGLTHIAESAVKMSGVDVKIHDVVISIDGKIKSEK